MAAWLCMAFLGRVLALDLRRPQEETLHLSLGVAQDLVQTVDVQDLEPLRAYLDAEGVSVHGVQVENSFELADRLVTEEVDVGVFAPVDYVRQHARYPALVPFATHVVNGMRYMQGYVVVRQDSGIEDLAGLRGKRFAYTGPDAFGGHLFPRYALIKAGFQPARFFSKTVMTRDYLESLRLVYEREVDGAGVLDEVLRLGEAIDIPRKAFRVLAKSRRVPHIAYVARPGLPDPVVDRVLRLLKGKRFKKLFLRAAYPGFPRNRALARLTPRREPRWNINGFISCSDRDFDEIRRMLAIETTAHAEQRDAVIGQPGNFP